MFNGIIQSIGLIEKFESDNFYIKTSLDLSNCKIGSSISCNGVCLTATSIKKFESNSYIFSVNISEETLQRTNFSSQNLNQIINLEKSLRLGEEISGHFVYGHVDCVTKISTINKLDKSWFFEFEINQSSQMNKFIVEKGSVAINGISLTISEVFEKKFSVSIIPHTYYNTNLKKSKAGDLVNIEFDALARYLFKNESK
tara:strand:+ start:87 stop:683 length:597 start_codon:yes stop_codon:yes gene_type:complete